MNTDVERPLKFGSFELDLRSRELRKGTARVRLQDQPFEILRLMLERPGHVVTRDELRHHLWPEGTFVDFEHSLNAAVKRLRAALGDDADNPSYVETLPRRGYRFIGPVDETRAAEASAGGTPRVRMAVLPFTCLGDEQGQEYFTDGLTEEMIAQLGRLCRGRIGVIARQSSMTFKATTRGAREIGQALRAGYLLEGSVRREGDRVRITARLVETAGETNLWVETYERHLTDYLSVQAEVAARIARSLAMELAPEPPSSSLVVRSPDTAAYQAYLKARYAWNKPGDEAVEEALAYFQQAIGADPSYAPGYSGLARAHVSLAERYHECPRLALEKARDAAERALQLDPALSEAHLALGEVRRMLQWDTRAARSAYSQAIALNPSYETAHRAYALMLTSLGRHAQAIREADRARELDPLCLTVNTSAAWVRYAAGDYASAIEVCLHTIGIDDLYYPAARRLLGAAYLQLGREKDALQVLETACEAGGVDPVAMAWLTHARAVLGHRAEAAGLLTKLERLARQRYVPPYHLAIAHAGLGDIDMAFDALARAAEDRDPLILNVAVDPRFAPLRGDQRYLALVSRLGL
ncbi:MAG TPA: winged helix-turn-helix domain-containing protein [Vicinamibacterales bacterium]